MGRDELADWAGRLLDDYDALRPWRTFAPPVGLTAERSYSLQGEVARLREGRGERVIGYKIGCTSRAIQDQLGIREPIFARLFDTACFPSASGSAMPDSSTWRSRASWRSACRGTCRAIPCRMRRTRGHRGGLPGDRAAPLRPAGGRPFRRRADRVRRDACGAGPRRAGNGVFGPCPGDGGGSMSPSTTTWRGRPREPWTMGGPAATLRWLTARLAERDLQLRRGQVILTGSALPLFPVGTGQPRRRRGPPAREEFGRDRLIVPPCFKELRHALRRHAWSSDTCARPTTRRC